jgi:histidyl-tRNA synthetase
MNSPLQTPKGTHDLLPEDFRYLDFVQKTVEKRLKDFGFGRISTPVFEFKDLFVRTSGETADIVEKELYAFASASGKEYALKPEGTAGVVRAYIQHGMHCLPQPVMLYYLEPHFRHDRPQAGRFRQFYQFGFEIIGESDPALDAQAIALAHGIHEDLGIASRLSLQINSLGCAECRTKFSAALQEFYFDKKRSLCETCQTRLEKNPLRLLDCKEEDCHLLASLAPKLSEFICPDCHTHQAQVEEFLDELGISFQKNPTLVRGLDYYTRTVFEFWDEKEGAQNAVGGGGRYDNLIKKLGGPETPALGYAGGIERIISHIKSAQVSLPAENAPQIFLAALGQTAKVYGLKLLEELREAGMRAVGVLGKSSVKAQLKLADRYQTPFTLILGQIELNNDSIIIRNMKKGSQESVRLKEVVKVMKKKLKQ